MHNKCGATGKFCLVCTQETEMLQISAAENLQWQIRTKLCNIWCQFSAEDLLCGLNKNGLKKKNQICDKNPQLHVLLWICNKV